MKDRQKTEEHMLQDHDPQKKANLGLKGLNKSLDLMFERSKLRNQRILICRALWTEMILSNC